MLPQIRTCASRPRSSFQPADQYHVPGKMKSILANGELQTVGTCMYIHAYVSSSARCLTATLWLRPLVRTHLYNQREQINNPYYLFVPVPPRWTIRVGGRAHITRERQSEFIPLSTRKNNRRPPSWRTHSITTRLGPGGGAHLLQLDRAIRPARPLGSDPGT